MKLSDTFLARLLTIFIKKLKMYSFLSKIVKFYWKTMCKLSNPFSTSDLFCNYFISLALFLKILKVNSNFWLFPYTKSMTSLSFFILPSCRDLTNLAKVYLKFNFLELLIIVKTTFFMYLVFFSLFWARDLNFAMIFLIFCIFIREKVEEISVIDCFFDFV